MVSTRSSSQIVNEALSPPTPSQSPSKARKNKTSSNGWYHAPTRFTLFWMAVSLPLVIWDTIYVLGRPLTMEGGSMHWPLWVPYKLYGEVDHVYGWKSFNAKNGFTAAQGSLNVVETVMYLVYLYMVYGEGWRISGRKGAQAALIGFSAAVMTLSKTVLYWANEYYSGFDNIGHNSVRDLIFLWIIPNGAWLIGSSEMIWNMSSNIVDGLAAASTRDKKD